MAITIVRQPEALSFSQNPVFYELQSDNRLTLLGSQAVNRVFFGGAVANGTVVSLRYNGREVRLTAQPTGGQPGLEFPDGDGSASYVESLVPYFVDNFYLARDFEIEYQLYGGVPSVVFTARKEGPDYNFIGQVNAGVTVAVLTAGARPVVKPNFSIYVELYIQNAAHTGYDLVFNEALPTDDDGTVQWNISELLHPQLTPDQPTWAGMGLKKNLASTRNYYIRYAEAYGENFQIGKITPAATKQVLLGGTPYKDGSAVTVLNKLWENNDPDRDKALRYGADTRGVFPDEPQYLTFLNTRGDVEGGLWSLKVTLTYIGSTDTETFYVSPESVAVALGEKVTYAVGFAQLDLMSHGDSESVIKQYSVQLFDISTPISRPYTYILDYADQPYRRYFVYQNSLGAFDTLTTWGKLSAELELTRQTASRYLPPDYALPDGHFTDWNITSRQRFEVATGFRTQAQIIGLRDFYLSRYKYRVTHTAAYPISVVNSSIKEGKEGDNLFAHLFEYTYQFEDDTYSDTLESPGSNPGETYALRLGFLGATSDPIQIVLPPSPGFGEDGAPLFDPTPQQGSQNIPRSGGVFEALAGKQPLLPQGASGQYLRGNHTLGNLNQDVRSITANVITEEELIKRPELLTLPDREPAFSDISPLSFTVGLRQTQAINLADFLLSDHDPTDLRMKLLSKSEWVSTTQVSGLQVSVTAQALDTREGTLLVEVLDPVMGFSRTVSIPLVAAPEIETRFYLFDALNTARIAPIPADNSGIFQQPGRWDVQYEVTQLHDGVYMRTWGGGPNGDALDFQNTSDDFEAVSPTISGLYRQFFYYNGTPSPPGLYNTQFKAFRNGQEIFSGTVTFTLVSEVPTEASTVLFQIWDESSTPTKIADFLPNNTLTLPRPAVWDVYMLVDNILHNQVYAHIRDTAGEVLFQWGTPYESVTETDSASYQLFGPGGYQSEYGPGTRYVFFQCLLDGEEVFNSTAAFTLTSPPVAIAELWDESSTPAKVRELPDAGSTTLAPSVWNVYFQVANTQHTEARWVIEKLVSGAYVSINDQTSTFSPISAQTYPVFGVLDNTDYDDTYPLEDGTYRATLYLKNETTDLPAKVVVFSLSPVTPIDPGGGGSIPNGAGLRTTNILIKEVDGNFVDLSEGDSVDGEGRRYRVINGSKFIVAYHVSQIGRIYNSAISRWVSTKLICNANGHAIDLKIKKKASYVGRTLTFRKIYYNESLGYDTRAIEWWTVGAGQYNLVYKSSQHILRIS